jgi:hypothetical protein
MRWLNVFARILGLIGKLGILSIRYPISRRKGLSAFEKELRRMGIEQDAIRELSQSYKSIGDIRTLAKLRKITRT